MNGNNNKNFNNNNNNMNMGGGDDASDPSGMMMGEIMNNMVGGDEGGGMMMHHHEHVHVGDNNVYNDDELTSNGTITNETMVDIIVEDILMLNDNDKDKDNMNSSNRHDQHHHHHHEMMNHNDRHNDNIMNHGGSQSSEIHHVHHHGSLGAVGDDSNNGFCKGQAGMVMFMEGFQFALKGESTCINLYFPGWTLDKAWKVVIAMIGVTVLAISTEAISKLRHNLSVKARSTATTQQQQQRNNIQLIQIALHGIHALTGYILMLATMTYSLELLLCVILGLVIGYAIFGGDQYPHVSTNPCCAFLEDEAQDRDDVAQLLERDNNDDVDDDDNDNDDDYDQTVELEVDIHGGSNECCMEQPIIDLSKTARNINDEGV